MEHQPWGAVLVCAYVAHKLFGDRNESRIVVENMVTTIAINIHSGQNVEKLGTNSATAEQGPHQDYGKRVKKKTGFLAQSPEIWRPLFPPYFRLGLEFRAAFAFLDRTPRRAALI